MCEALFYVIPINTTKVKKCFFQFHCQIMKSFILLAMKVEKHIK